MKIYVICQNDTPLCVFTKLEDAEAYIVQRRERADDSTIYIWYREVALDLPQGEWKDHATYLLPWNNSPSKTS